MKKYNMNKYCLLTTYYNMGQKNICKNNTKIKFNYDGNIDDLFINFSNEFDPNNTQYLAVGVSRRKDLIYGKIFLLKEYIKNYILNKYKFICHIDYSDVKFARSFVSMMEKFETSGIDFIIATEKICWPYLDTVRCWSSSSLEEKEFEYVNSGCIISKTEVLYEYLNELTKFCLTLNIDFWDDQGVWQYYHTNIKKLNADKICEYFFCTALLDETYYYIDDNKIKTKFNTYPYLIHDNSSFSLNLINRI